MDGKRRKDQWTAADDERLAEIVIQAVQNGKTQLEAFSKSYKTSLWFSLE